MSAPGMWRVVESDRDPSLEFLIVDPSGRLCAVAYAYDRCNRADANRIVDGLNERDRLVKLFDDAGQGEHNVLALVDHYQSEVISADARIAKVLKLLELNGCDCCTCDECTKCLACQIEEALAEGGEK